MMKKITCLFVAIALLAASCSSNKSVSLLVINPLDQQRDDAIIVLTIGEIESWIDIPVKKVPLLTDRTGNPLPCQVDDVDGDGAWDELFALADLGPLGEMSANLVFVTPENFPRSERRTNVRLGAAEPGYPELLMADRLEGVTYQNHTRTREVYQMEGPAWENDMVGFRNYLDQRNGMDIFGKLTGEMVLDSVGISTRQSYHEPDVWGMDILKVGTSLGSGSIAYQFNDSLYRVGDSGSGSYRLVFEGPLRSRFNLSYSDWMVDGNPVEVLQQIEIVAGRYCFQSFVTYSGTGMNLDLAPGIVNMFSDTLLVMELNDFFSGLVTHDLQTEDTTLLAMALMVPTIDLIRAGETRESGEGITQTYYALLDAEPGQPVPFRFYALWEKTDPRWASIEEVTAFLEAEAERWTQSVMVVVQQ